ncbi:hypothetical protein D046_4736, partial [Vibrio parahaemolyticus V-223/04]
GEITEYVEY